jgi:hypothetical protein
LPHDPRQLVDRQLVHATPVEAGRTLRLLQ